MRESLAPPPTIESPASADESLLVEYLRTGNADLFRALVERHKTRVFRLVASLLGPELSSDAEDVAQEVFIRVFRYAPSFRGDCRFSTWLYRIAYSRAVEHRGQSRHRLLDTSDESLADAPAGKTPLAEAAARQRGRIVWACLDELPDLYRSVVHLHYWMGCTVEEMAELLEAPPGTIKSYLHRARERLAIELKKRGIRDESPL